MVGCLARRSPNTNPRACRKMSFGSLARSKPDPAPPGIWLVALRAIPTHTAGNYLAAIVSSYFQVDDRIALNLYNHSGVSRAGVVAIDHCLAERAVFQQVVLRQRR